MGYHPEMSKPSQRRRNSSISIAALVALAQCLLAASYGSADSTLVLELEMPLENVAATTFNLSGDPLGQSSFKVERSGSGAHHMAIEMAIEGGGTNRSQATLMPLATPLAQPSAAGSLPLRLLEQRSQPTRADGIKLPLLVIDHVQKRVSCYANGEDKPGQHVDLPEEDRVVNVPLQLLFQPLVKGRVDELRFQFALCRDGPVLQNMVAKRGRTTGRTNQRVIEIGFGPDFGRAATWLAQRLLPKFSFWFDVRGGEYRGHRMPLHRKGPEILLVRQGYAPLELGLLSD